MHVCLLFDWPTEWKLKTASLDAFSWKTMKTIAIVMYNHVATTTTVSQNLQLTHVSVCVCLCACFANPAPLYRFGISSIASSFSYTAGNNRYQKYQMHTALHNTHNRRCTAHRRFLSCMRWTICLIKYGKTFVMILSHLLLCDLMVNLKVTYLRWIAKYVNLCAVFEH